MRSLQMAPGVTGWTRGTYHRPLPAGLPDKTEVTIVWVPDCGGTCIVVRDPAGTLWHLQRWVVEIGRWVTLGSRKLPEWHADALDEIGRMLGEHLRRIEAAHRFHPLLADWRTLAEYSHWELVRNGRTPADLPWEPEEPQAGWAYQIGRCWEVMPELARQIEEGATTKRPEHKPRTSGRFR